MPKTRKSATSYKQTRFGILPRNKVVELEVIGTVKGLTLLKDIAQRQTPLSTGLLLKIHKTCFCDILINDAGRFRVLQVMYSGKEAPHFSKVPELMKNLCDDIEYRIKGVNSGEDTFINDVVKILAVFQHRFVLIHPFVDYNGRMARMFTNYILMRLSLPIIEIQVKSNRDRRRYISALQRADEGKYQTFENLISVALNESLQKASI